MIRVRWILAPASEIGGFTVDKQESVSLLHGISGAGAMLLSLFTTGSFPGPAEIVKPVGILIFAAGIILTVYTVAVIKEALLGNVLPVTDTLISNGPYRFVRHPVYLGMIISIAGLGIMLRSIWGVLGTFLLFVPAAVYRAKQEEIALQQKFKADWQDYAKQTYFMFPPIY